MEDQVENLGVENVSVPVPDDTSVTTENPKCDDQQVNLDSEKINVVPSDANPSENDKENTQTHTQDQDQDQAQAQAQTQTREVVDLDTENSTGPSDASPSNKKQKTHVPQVQPPVDFDNANRNGPNFPNPNDMRQQKPGVFLKFVDQKGNPTHMRVQRYAKLGLAFDQYRKKNKVQGVSFVFNGYRLNPRSTPLEGGEQIDVFTETFGGGCNSF